jgi:hypothetical protein
MHRRRLHKNHTYVIPARPNEVTSALEVKAGIQLFTDMDARQKNSGMTHI